MIHHKIGMSVTGYLMIRPKQDGLDVWQLLTEFERDSSSMIPGIGNLILLFLAQY